MKQSKIQRHPTKLSGTIHSEILIQNNEAHVFRKVNKTCACVVTSGAGTHKTKNG